MANEALVTRTYRAAIRCGEDFITIEETIALPPTASDAEIAQAVDAAIAQSGATGAKDMGKVMGALKSRLAGKADMGKVSALVKARLGG